MFGSCSLPSCRTLEILPHHNRLPAESRFWHIGGVQVPAFDDDEVIAVDLVNENPTQSNSPHCTVPVSPYIEEENMRCRLTIYMYVLIAISLYIIIAHLGSLRL